MINENWAHDFGQFSTQYLHLIPNMLANLILLVQIAALTLSFFLIVIIFKRSDKQNYSNKLLLWFLFIKNYGLFLFIILKTGLLNDLWFLYRTGLPTSLFLPALGYLYLRSVVNDEQKFNKPDLIHLTPLVVGLIQYLPYYFSDIPFKKQIVKNLGDLSGELALEIGVLPESEFTLIRGLVFLIYAVLIVRFVLQKVSTKNQVSNPFQTLDLKVLKWTKIFGISFSLSCLMVFGYFYLPIVQNLNGNTVLISILGIGIALFFNGSLIYYSSYLIINPETLIGLYRKPNLIGKKNSNAREDDFADIIYQIKEELNRHKIHNQSDINVEKLAQNISQPTRLTSYVINNYFGMNFNQLINSYRIEEAIEELKNGYLNKFTLDALWSKIGFSNRTTFYKRFKDTTGLTPVEFVKLNREPKDQNLPSE